MTTENRRTGLARRHAICEAALDLAAAGGNRAVTHHAIDDRLGVARGSTSYYYRTRQTLLEAAIKHLADTSREAFHAALRTPARHRNQVDGAADLIAAQLESLLTERRRDALARYALATDAAADGGLRAAIATCLFSLPAATTLTAGLSAPDPAAAAQDLLSLLEGLLFDRLYGTRALLRIEAGTAASFHDLRSVIHRYLVGLRHA